MQTNYTTGRTWFNEEKELWGTDVGTVNEKGELRILLHTSWGTSESNSKEAANLYIEQLTFITNP